MNEKNAILEELWEVRRQIEEENHNDIKEIYKKYKKRQMEHPSDYYEGKPIKLQRIKTV